jgi:hypothetical protein
MSIRPPLNYTTKIPAKRTVSECQDLLITAGARSVTLETESRRPTGLAFQLDTSFGVRAFRLPVNHLGVGTLLRRVDQADAWPPGLYKGGAGTKERARFVTEDHALDVAWRITRDWLEVQLAIIDAEMVTADEVMLPYMLVDPQTTVFDQYRAGNAIEAAR